MKYTILEAVSLGQGIIFPLAPLILITIVTPALNDLYSTLNVNSSVTSVSYITLAVSIILGLINLFFGWKLIWGDMNTKKKFFIYGIVILFVTDILYAASFVPLVLSMTSPINKLYSQP